MRLITKLKHLTIKYDARITFNEHDEYELRIIDVGALEEQLFVGTFGGVITRAYDHFKKSISIKKEY